MRTKKVSVYEGWSTREAARLMKLFGDKKLAIACVDEILYVLTKMDARCKSWRLVKEKLVENGKL